MRSTLDSVFINAPSLSKSSSKSVVSGTRTCLIHIGFCMSDRYLAISRMFELSNPVSSLCLCGLISFISSITKSVYFISSLNFPKNGSSRVNGFPAVSSVVWIPFSFASLNRAVTNSICKSGSPPLTVIPPSAPQ